MRGDSRKRGAASMHRLVPPCTPPWTAPIDNSSSFKRVNSRSLSHGLYPEYERIYALTLGYPTQRCAKSAALFPSCDCLAWLFSTSCFLPDAEWTFGILLIRKNWRIAVAPGTAVIIWLERNPLCKAETVNCHAMPLPCSDTCHAFLPTHCVFLTVAGSV